MFLKLTATSNDARACESKGDVPAFVQRTKERRERRQAGGGSILCRPKSTC